MNFIVLGAALFVGSLIEDLTPAWTSMGGAEIPIMLGIVLYYALNRSLTLMLSAAVLAGIISDALFALPLGTALAALLLVGAVCRGFRDVAFIGRPMTQLILGTAATAAYTLLVYSRLALADPQFKNADCSWLVAKLLGTCLLAALTVPLIFILMRRLDMMMGNISKVEQE